MAICLVLECIEMNVGTLFTHSPILIVIKLVLIELCNENSFRACSCLQTGYLGPCYVKLLFFLRLGWVACMLAYKIIYSEPVLLRDTSHCMHTQLKHTQHDVTRAYM